MTKRSRHGFTLIELMITVAIIGVVAAIAIPLFTFYRSKAKATEVKAIMGNLVLSENNFYASYDNFANVPTMNPLAVPPGVYRRPWEYRLCPAGCGRTAPALCTEFSCMGFEPSGTLLYSYTARSFTAGGPSRVEYALGGLGDTDGDLTTGSFSYQTSNTVTGGPGLNTDGISACLVGIPSDELLDCRPGAF